MRRIPGTAYLAIILFLLPGASSQPRAELPVLITSCGQSPGATMLKVILKRAALKHTPKAYDTIPLARAEDLKTALESGAPYKSVIVVMGASLKGMGAAGISIDDELERITSLIEEAKNQGITVIGAHIEGMKRRARGASVGDNTDEQSIDTVAPFSDILVVKKEGNTDNRFTDIATAGNIPLIEVEKQLELIDIFKNIFSK